MKKSLSLLCLLVSIGSAEEEFLYRADFDDGRAPGWNLKKTSRWTFEDGALVQENLSKQYTVLYRLGHASWTDFEVRLKVRFLKRDLFPEAPEYLRLKVRGVDVDMVPGRQSVWWKPVGSKTSKGIHNRDRSTPLDPNHWYEFHVEYHPSRLTFRQDGKVVADLKDPPPFQGSPVMIYFGNLKIALDYFRVVDREPVGQR